MRATGKLRLEGKDDVVQDGDVMHLRFNLGPKSLMEPGLPCCLNLPPMGPYDALV